TSSAQQLGTEHGCSLQGLVRSLCGVLRDRVVVVLVHGHTTGRSRRSRPSERRRTRRCRRPQQRRTDPTTTARTSLRRVRQTPTRRVGSTHRRPDTSSEAVAQRRPSPEGITPGRTIACSLLQATACVVRVGPLGPKTPSEPCTDRRTLTLKKVGVGHDAVDPIPDGPHHISDRASSAPDAPSQAPTALTTLTLQQSWSG